MTLEIINASAAPVPVGPYSHAVATNGLLFCSGQIPLDPVTGQMVAGGIKEQSQQAIANLIAVLDHAGVGAAALAKVTVYLTDMNNFAVFNQIYEQALGNHRPARAVVGVAALPKGALIEIEGIACR